MNSDKNNLVLSIVVPCYNEEACIRPFYEEVKKQNLPKLEFVFVDDGSSDNTLAEIKFLSDISECVHYVSFSRNFGKEAALLAGLRAASGDLIVTMDVDLQHPPEILPQMVSAIVDEKFDSVATRRCNRNGEPWLRSLFSCQFYKIMQIFSDVRLVSGTQDYRMMCRAMVDAILSLREVNRFTKGIYQWVGFNTKWIAYANVERTKGQTKWSFWKLVKYAWEGILGFSTLPLKCVSLLGGLFCLISAIYFLYVFFKTLFLGEVVRGYPTLICTTIFIGGVQMLCIGMIGAYLAKIYLETKQRPIYVVREKR